jgi:alkanesulfonate monooxygenase SsuD/methylene tetrahydromethanopterin reductase-like flavin-dependent oxidoreductase (luciferase family)
MRDLWSKGRSTFHGKHFDVDGAICRPLPLQDGGIPLWIAGGGEKRTLRTAAKYADYTNFSSDPEAFAHKSAVLAAHCKDVGRDFGSITRSSGYPVIVGTTEREAQERLNWIIAHYTPLLPPKEMEALEHAYRNARLLGTPEQIVDKLRSAEGQGMAYAICTFVDAAYDRSGMELFERKVIPALT